MLQVLRLGSLALRQPICRRFSTRSRVPIVAMAAQSSKYYSLHYQYVPDILEKRGPHREGHLAAARKQTEAGKLLIAGAVGDPVDGGLFIFKDVTKQEVEEFVKNDVYVTEKLVNGWTIQPFNAVAGTEVTKS